MKKILVAAGAIIIIVLMSGRSLATDNKKENEAVAVAKNWIMLIDKEKYSESWREAASYFRNAVKRDQWKQSLQSVRMPLGNVVSRKLKSTLYQTTMPGAPDGEYVVIQFETSFVNKRSAIETVTTMIDKDDQWRVSGYYMK